MRRQSWGTSFFTTAGGRIGNLESKQSDVEYWGFNMPSNAFIFYTTSRIPNLVKKYMILKYTISEELANMYIGILTCRVCSVHTRSTWRNQVNTLFLGAMERLYCAGNMEELMVLDSRIPNELNRAAWMPSVIREFTNYADKTCAVLNLMLEEGLVRRIPDHRAGQNICIRTYYESTTRINMITQGHFSELLNNESLDTIWDPTFVSAVLTQHQRSQDGTPLMGERK